MIAQLDRRTCAACGLVTSNYTAEMVQLPQLPAPELVHTPRTRCPGCGSPLENTPADATGRPERGGPARYTARPPFAPEIGAQQP